LLLLDIGSLNGFPLLSQLVDAAIIDLRDAAQAIVDEIGEAFLDRSRFKPFCSISDELPRHVRHRTWNIRLPLGTKALAVVEKI
jgi:hypothetical protein